MPYVLWLLIFPLLASIICFVLLSSVHFKKGAIALSLLPLLLLIAGNTNWIGSEVNVPWFQQLAIHFHLRIDNLAYLFLLLTSFIVPISLYAFKESPQANSNAFYGLVFLLQFFLNGFFMAQDLVLFTVFWEAMLFPLYFIINLWGGTHRQSTALKFLLYMLAGSVFMVAGVLALYFAQGNAGTFEISALNKVAEQTPYSAFIFAAFLLAFAVKTPLFPFHGWLPDTYYEAPTAGTILLAGLLSKAGIFGILRIAIGLFPATLQAWSPWLLGLAIAGVLYGGLIAWRQNDFKRLIAYSSFSHVNFILAGLFVWNATAHTGAVLQALNHGITITALFLAASWLADRLGSTRMESESGMAKFLPRLCWFTLLFVLSSVALPGTNTFVGELLILFGLFGSHPWLTALLALSVILSVMYMLRWMQKIYFGPPALFKNSWSDIKSAEVAVSLGLAAVILWIGLYPAPLLQQIQPTVHQLGITNEGQ